MDKFIAVLGIVIVCVVHNFDVVDGNAVPPQEQIQDISLASSVECSKQFKDFCPEIKQNSFNILHCVQNKLSEDVDRISRECHNLLWTYKLNLTKVYICSLSR